MANHNGSIVSVAMLPAITVHNVSVSNCSLSDNTADLEETMLMIHGYIIPIMAAVGVVLNTLNLVVLSHANLVESSYTYLTGLAFADLCMLALFLINGIGRGHFPTVGGWRVFEAFIYFPCGFMTSTAGALLTVTVSVERFIFIYRPLKARQWCNRRVAHRVMVVIWVACVAVNIPRFFVFEVDHDAGVLSYTEFGKSNASNYLSWFQFLFVSCSCGLALIILNILLLYGIHKTNHRRQAIFSKSAGHHQRKDELRLTRTLISIVLVYLIGEIPSSMTSRLLVVGLSGDPCIVETRGFKIASLVATVLVLLQLSLNFVVYCVFNRRFWAIFKQQMCSCVQSQAVDNNQPEATRFVNNNSACELSILHPVDNHSTIPIAHGQCLLAH